MHSEGHDDREKEHHVDREGAGMRPISSPVLPFAFHRRLTLVVSFSAGVERQQDAQHARHETQPPHRVLDQDAQPEEHNRPRDHKNEQFKNTVKILLFQIATPFFKGRGASHRIAGSNNQVIERKLNYVKPTAVYEYTRRLFYFFYFYFFYQRTRPF